MSEESAHLNDAYELDATAAWVRAGGHARVALQMPDELLHDAVAVAAALTRRCNEGASVDVDACGGVRFFVLADTTFGSCCVDEVAAAHHRADAIVHFGRACMSPVARLPARFVFHKVPLDVPACAAAIRDHAASIAATDASRDQEYKTDALIVLVDQEHAHEAAKLRQSLLESTRDAPAPAATPIVVAEPLPVEALPRERSRAGTAFMDGPASTSCCGGGCGSTACACGADACGECAPPLAPSLAPAGSAAASTSTSSAAAAEFPGGERVAGQRFVLPPGVVDRERCAFVWVGGGESPALTQALATLHGRCRGVAQVDPATSALSAEATGSAQVGRVVKRRRFLIEKAREARVVGIVAGTLGVAGYLTAIARLRELIARSGRKSYTVVAGKPNPQKLANFPEIEAFVLVACEQAALIDGRDYLQPVITPWEAEVAFTHGSVWDGEVRLNFEHLLEPARRLDDTDDTDAAARADDDAEPEFSFLGGGVRTASRPDDGVGCGHSDGEDSEDDGVLGDGSRSRAARQLAIRADAAVATRAAGGTIAVVNSGAEYLLGRRTYTGLEPGPKRDEDGAAADAPLEAAQGLSGRARGYADERGRGDGS